MVFRISTLSTSDTDGVDYQTGDLSLYPEVLDDKSSLYVANNNAEATLKQSLGYNNKFIIVDDATAFPPHGLLRISKSTNPDSFELVYYDKRNDTTFMNIIRGFAGSNASAWQSIETTVKNAVMAEHHNAVKDAILKLESNLGTQDSPTTDSLNGILKSLEYRFLAPKPLFKAFPLEGIAGTKVRFQNFSNSEAIRFLWDFGDGTTSSEKSPTHIYQTEGVFTVKLNMILSTGAQGITIKADYITISNANILPFFYAKLLSDSNVAPAEYEFVDQTNGEISARYWVFDDGTNEQIDDPNNHSVIHTYDTTGTYDPSLLIIFKDQTTRRVFLQKNIEVT